MANKLSPFKQAWAMLWHEWANSMDYETFCQQMRMAEYLAAQYDNREPIPHEVLMEGLRKQLEGFRRVAGFPLHSILKEIKSDG